MARFWTYTRVEDNGPFVGKLILELPAEVRPSDAATAAFSVYSERRDAVTGEVVLAKAHHGDPDNTARPSMGYPEVLRTYSCDASGKEAAEPSRYLALDLPEVRLTKHIDGGITASSRRMLIMRATQTAALPVADPTAPPLAGLVFDECAGDICPDLAGWDLTLSGTYAGIQLNYGLFSPNLEVINARRTRKDIFGAPTKEPLVRVPLLLWLHGGGEGGGEPFRMVTGNKVTALSGTVIQEKLGGAAYVLAPSSPTFWMDSGAGQIVDDNQTIYTEALKALVDEVIAAHPDIDRSRIYVGGLSNGGFMTLRLIANYPGFFAAAAPVCAPWVGDLGTSAEYDAMAQTPIWAVQVNDDVFVQVDTHIKTMWPRLLAAGARDAHLTYYDVIADETGRYKDSEGRPNTYNGHFVWINVYHDTIKTELDGTNVLWDSFPVTLWEWMGKHTL